MSRKIGISLKIDVKKIEKARLYAGEKGTYLDATVFIDVDDKDQYGNSGMITQNVSKEEKESGTLGNILGNCKVFWKDGLGQNQGQNQGQQSNSPAPENFNDDIPF